MFGGNAVIEFIDSSNDIFILSLFDLELFGSAVAAKKIEPFLHNIVIGPMSWDCNKLNRLFYLHP